MAHCRRLLCYLVKIELFQEVSLGDRVAEPRQLAVIGEDLDLVDVVEGDRAASTGRS